MPWKHTVFLQACLVAMLSCHAGVEEILAKGVSAQSLLGKIPAELQLQLLE